RPPLGLRPPGGLIRTQTVAWFYSAHWPDFAPPLTGFSFSSAIIVLQRVAERLQSPRINLPDLTLFLPSANLSRRLSLRRRWAFRVSGREFGQRFGRAALVIPAIERISHLDFPHCVDSGVRRSKEHGNKSVLCIIAPLEFTDQDGCDLLFVLRMTVEFVKLTNSCKRPFDHRHVGRSEMLL
ncbi:hypothetical protein, partial [Mesorhizobium sp. A556]